MIEVGGVAPFANGEELLHQIDRIKLGHILWQSFTAAYTGDQPVGPDCPVWMREKYKVWFHNPREIVHNILGNPEFSNGIDYIPDHDFINGELRRCEFMSGNWAWRQVVGIHTQQVDQGC